MGLRKHRARGRICYGPVARIFPRWQLMEHIPIHVITNANANCFSSPTGTQSERVARRNCMKQLRARSFRARHNTQLHVNCMPRLRPAASRNCGQQLHAATASHGSHAIRYYIMRGIAETSGAWSDLLGEQPWPKEHSDGHPIHPPLDVIMA